MPVQKQKRTAEEVARAIEVANLRTERDRLRKQLAAAKVTEQNELIMLRAEVAGLSAAAARAGLGVGPKHMSEGVREEVERVGYSVDPWTNEVVTRDDLPGSGE